MKISVVPLRNLKVATDDVGFVIKTPLTHTVTPTIVAVLTVTDADVPDVIVTEIKVLSIP